MNFLQIQDEVFVDAESIKAIYRDGSVLKVDVDSLDDYIVSEEFERGVLAFATDHAHRLVSSTFGNRQ